MKIDILTLFPEMFDGFKGESIIKRAIDNKKIEINTHNFRDYSLNKHKKVDDTPYGGGNGMVLMCQPIFDCVEKIKKDNSKVILLSPQGKKYDQSMAYKLSKEEHLILICGHYEGFDERIKNICDEEISIGDYVLTGGELPAMVIADSVTRLLPGVIEEESHLKESFNNNLLDYPTYTKPRNYKGMKVPDVLLSGNHAAIKKWREEKQINITSIKRPDLLAKKTKIDKTGLKRSRNEILTDDIKNIKVVEVKEKKQVKKTGKFVLFKDDKTRAVTVLKPRNIAGYKLKAKNKDGSVSRILIVKESFIEKAAIKNIMKKINILTYRFNLALNDSDDEATSRVLGEAEMLKSFIISTYAMHLGKENLDKIIKNINLLVSEFVKAKSVQNSMLVNEIENSKRR